MEYAATNELQNVIPWPLATILSPLATCRSPLPPDSLATILPPLPTPQAGILQKNPNIKGCSAICRRPARDGPDHLPVTRERAGRMRILADENVPRPIVAWLRDTGHDVLYLSRKVRETRSSSSQKRSERSAEGPPTLWHQRQLVPDPVSPELDGRLVEISRGS